MKQKSVLVIKILVQYFKQLNNNVECNVVKLVLRYYKKRQIRKFQIFVISDKVAAKIVNCFFYIYNNLIKLNKTNNAFKGALVFKIKKNTIVSLKIICSTIQFSLCFLKF